MIGFTPYSPQKGLKEFRSILIMESPWAVIGFFDGKA